MMGTLSLNLPCFIVEALFGGRRRWVGHGKMSRGWFVVCHLELAGLAVAFEVVGREVA